MQSITLVSFLVVALFSATQAAPWSLCAQGTAQIKGISVTGCNAAQNTCYVQRGQSIRASLTFASTVSYPANTVFTVAAYADTSFLQNFPVSSKQDNCNGFLGYQSCPLTAYRDVTITKDVQIPIFAPSGDATFRWMISANNQNVACVSIRANIQ